MISRCALLLCAVAAACAAGAAPSGDPTEKVAVSGSGSPQRGCEVGPDQQGCRVCTPSEKTTIPVCAGHTHRRASCVNSTIIFAECTVYSDTAPLPSGPSFAMFQLGCLAAALVCGILMRNRKRVLVAQQQERYSKLLERAVATRPGGEGRGGSGGAMPGKNAIFVAATGQHVGKTATCLGLLGGLRSRMPNVGFMKPVGQGTVSVGGVTVDNDVHLMRGAFDLQHLRYQDMSPVVLDPTYTRAFLDGEVCSIDTMKGRITEAFETVHRSSAYTVVEGTGHMGVGSIVGLNNATVAKLLGVDVILVSSGGVGSAFDEIALNLQLCEAIGVGVRGVVLNKVQPEKLEMVQRYIQLALDNTWGHVPLLGCIPFCPDLACPSLANIRDHLRAEVLSGEDQLSKRFPNRRLVSTTSDAYYELLHSVDMEAEKDVMVITPSARADIIFATIVKWTDSPHDSGAFMLTGARPPSPEVQLLLKRANIPSLYVAHPTLEVAYSISQFVPKTQAGDKARIEQTVAHVAGAIDFDSFI